MSVHQRYAATETLKDGSTVLIRAARPEDAVKIRRAFHKLEPGTVYTRFFSHKREVTDADLARITDPKSDDGVALLATIGTDQNEEVIGGGSYSVIGAETPPTSAEIAFMVEEDYQGRGVAAALLRHLVRIARSKGIDRLEADVLTDNLAMLRVFSRSGLAVTLRQERGAVHVTLLAK